MVERKCCRPTKITIQGRQKRIVKIECLATANSKGTPIKQCLKPGKNSQSAEIADKIEVVTQLSSV